MTISINGTNGLIQAYDYQVLTTGFSYTFAAGTQVLVINPAGTLATGTITMPASPSDGMTITVESTQQVTALTMSGNGGTVVGAAVQLIPNQPLSWVYRSTGTTWYPFSGGAGRASGLVSGTVTASSGTALTYASLPSWAKRITVMIASLQTSSTTTPVIQLSAASTFKTSGYLSAVGVTAASSAASNNSTGGFAIGSSSWASSIVIHGSVTFTLLNSATYLWAASGVLARSDGTVTYYTAGSVTLAGVLDGIRLYIDGTQTFTAGSINILYE